MLFCYVEDVHWNHLLRKQWRVKELLLIFVSKLRGISSHVLKDLSIVFITKSSDMRRSRPQTPSKGRVVVSTVRTYFHKGWSSLWFRKLLYDQVINLGFSNRIYYQLNVVSDRIDWEKYANENTTGQLLFHYSSFR